MKMNADEGGGRYSVRASGSSGQEILNPHGETVAWTIDPVLAVVIAKVLTEEREEIGRSAPTHF